MGDAKGQNRAGPGEDLHDPQIQPHYRRSQHPHRYHRQRDRGELSDADFEPAARRNTAADAALTWMGKVGNSLEAELPRTSQELPRPLRTGRGISGSSGLIAKFAIRDAESGRRSGPTSRNAR